MAPALVSLFRIFCIYLRLGCISFGGPVAHLGYFKETFVTKHKWLDENRYAELLGLCQFVPGPSSSQLGFAIGWQRGGLPAACAAWLGFTLPSALLMIGFAYGLFVIGDRADQFIDGLLIAAVAVVANAVLGLGNKLCPDLPRLAIAAVSAIIVFLFPNSYMQIAVILLGALSGMALFRQQAKTSVGTDQTRALASRRTTTTALVLYTICLGLSFWMNTQDTTAVFAHHYRAGALVFGGGHVVLPLLNDSIVTGGLLSEDDFLSGYSAAQALPGPLFTFSAFVGTAARTTTPFWLGGVGALLAIFLPGMLLLVGILPSWNKLRQKAAAQAGLLGANAAVVGLLLAVFINPVWSHGISTWSDFAIATAAFFALYRFHAPAWLIVLACGCSGWLL